MADTELAVSACSELKALGVRLAMDDFGTGYSSLSYLSRFPVDILKMDRSFLRPARLAVTSGLATAVVALGETLELEVVAEGIELPEQSVTLRDLGCELGQGFSSRGRWTPTQLLEYLRGARATPTTRWRPRLGCSHSYEGLDRPGGFSRVRLLSPAARTATSGCCGRDVRCRCSATASSSSRWRGRSTRCRTRRPRCACVGIAMTIPTIAFLLVGGAVSDRFDRRRVMLAADAVRGLRCRR